MSTLAVIDVSKRYATNGHTLLALRHVSLEAARGEFVVLLGPSGCGKTTLLQIIAGLEAPSSGQVTIEGQPVNRPDRRSTMIFQKPNLFPWLTAEENVAFGLRMAGIAAIDRRPIIHAVLERMGLGDAAHLYPHELSGGMQQRVALARALVLNPTVLLMDEPLASLDALLRSRLQHEIRVACAGQTVLFVTHDIREALVLADRLVILSPRPASVQREITLSGNPPRSLTMDLLQQAQEIERELLVTDRQGAMDHGDA